MAPFNKFPEYFLCIANERSISRAAEMLHVSQPYLSQHLIKLEKSLGVTLFDRAQTPIEITSAGQLYQNYLESSFQLARKLSADLSEMETERENTLSLGLGSWRGSLLLPDILPAFRKRFPHVKISLHEHTISELYAYIDNNSVEMAIMNVNWITHKRYVREVISTEKILLVMNKNHHLIESVRREHAATGQVDLKALQEECFILLQPGIVCGDAVNAYLDRNKVFLPNRILTTNNSTVINLVAENFGICFMNEAGRRYASRLGCFEFFDLHSKDLEVPLAAVYKADSFLSPVARNFIDMTKEFYSGGEHN